MPTNGIFGLAEFALHLKEIERDMHEASRLIVRQARQNAGAELDVDLTLPAEFRSATRVGRKPDVNRRR
jgi:hypothetical protein